MNTILYMFSIIFFIIILFVYMMPTFILSFGIWGIWKASHSKQKTFCILYYSIIFGLIGFLAGFYGPIYFGPDANQGPLLGILFTGPLGALFGGLIGFIHAKIATKF